MEPLWKHTKITCKIIIHKNICLLFLPMTRYYDVLSQRVPSAKLLPFNSMNYESLFVSISLNSDAISIICSPCPIQLSLQESNRGNWIATNWNNIIVFSPCNRYWSPFSRFKSEFNSISCNCNWFLILPVSSLTGVVTDFSLPSTHDNIYNEWKRQIQIINACFVYRRFPIRPEKFFH